MRPEIWPRRMVERRKGSVINIGSVSGMRGDHRAAAYNAAKSGVINLTRSMAPDFGPRGIRVNCICPGAIGTPVILRQMTEQSLGAISRNTPLGRIGEGPRWPPSHCSSPRMNPRI